MLLAYFKKVVETGVKAMFSDGGYDLGFTDPADFIRAKEVLRGVGYTEEGLRETLGAVGLTSLRSIDEPIWLRRTRGGGPRDTLIRLFMIGAAVDAAAARRALRPMALESWVQAGLVQVQDDHVVPLVQIMVYKGLYLASDITRQIIGGARPDFVMGVGKSSMLLASVTVRRHARRTLDLGAGCGIHALLAAPHSDRVWATDNNPRAVAFARFNAAFNGFSNLEGRVGNLFEPVADQRFDLIVCNPPYVISPATHYLYRDSGMRGDQFCRRLTRQAAEFLEEGGFCQLISSWGHRADQPWRDCLHGWFEGIGCDALVLGGETDPVDSYASNWIRDTEPGDMQTFTRRYDQWLRYFEQEGIEVVSYGLIMLRRSTRDAYWVRVDEAPKNMMGPCGEFVLQAFEVEDFLASHRDDRDLLQARLRVSPHVRFEQICKPGGSGWSLSEARLRLARGLIYTVNVDSYVAGLAIRCDGTRTLHDLLAELADTLEVDRDRLFAEAIPVIQDLLRRGFVLPESADGAASTSA